MSRELRSDAVSSVDRSSSGIANEQPASQLERESMSTESMATTSNAVPTSAGGDEPTAATSTEHSFPVPENESTSTVSIITSDKEVMYYLVPGVFLSVHLSDCLSVNSFR